MSSARSGSTTISCVASTSGRSYCRAAACAARCAVISPTSCATCSPADAQHGPRHDESVSQVAIADRLVVTKTDLADPEPVSARLRRLNPAAPIVEAVFGDVAPSVLFGGGERDPRDLVYDDSPAHEHEVRALCLTFDEPLDWTAFGIWLTMLLQARGEDVLRVKGLLNVGTEGPLVLNGVQHVVHPPEHLPEWPDEDRRSRVVFIGRELEQETLERSLAAFNRL